MFMLDFALLDSIVKRSSIDEQMRGRTIMQNGFKNNIDLDRKYAVNVIKNMTSN